MYRRSKYPRGSFLNFGNFLRRYYTCVTIRRNKVAVGEWKNKTKLSRASVDQRRKWNPWKITIKLDNNILFIFIFVKFVSALYIFSIKLKRTLTQINTYILYVYQNISQKLLNLCFRLFFCLLSIENKIPIKRITQYFLNCTTQTSITIFLRRYVDYYGNKIVVILYRKRIIDVQKLP